MTRIFLNTWSVSKQQKKSLDNSGVKRLRDVGKGVCLFYFFIFSRTIVIQLPFLPPFPMIPVFTKFSLEQVRQSQSAGARISNTKTPSDVYEPSFYTMYTLHWVITVHKVLYKDNFWRLSVHGAQPKETTGDVFVHFKAALTNTNKQTIVGRKHLNLKIIDKIIILKVNCLFFFFFFER